MKGAVNWSEFWVTDGNAPRFPATPLKYERYTNPAAAAGAGAGMVAFAFKLMIPCTFLQKNSISKQSITELNWK